MKEDECIPTFNIIQVFQSFSFSVFVLPLTVRILALIICQTLTFLLKNINKLISELLTQTSAQYNLPARVQNVFKFSCPFSVPSKPFHITHFGICLGEGTSR